MSKKEVFIAVNVDLKGAENLGELDNRIQQLTKSRKDERKIIAELQKALREKGELTKQEQAQYALSTAAVGRYEAELTAAKAIMREARNEYSGLTDAGLRFRDKMADANIEALKASGILGQLEKNAAETRAEMATLNDQLQKGTITQDQYQQNTAELSTKLDRLNGDIGAVNARIEESTTDTKKLTAQSQALESELKDLAAQYAKGAISADQFAKGTKEIGTKLDQTNAKIDQFSAGIRGNIEGGIKGAFMNFATYAAGAFALQSLVSWGNELRKRGIEIEQVTARAKVLFGDSFDEINAKAVENGEAIGKTRVEYLQLASTYADVLTNLKFSTDQTAKYSEQLVETAADIEDFTAGQTTAEQATSILKNAMLGNLRGLRELGIEVKTSSKDIAIQAAEIQKSEGVTKKQAVAMANLQFAMEALGPKIEDFKQQQGDADKAADRTTASIGNQADALAITLAPAFTAATNQVANYIEGLNLSITSQETLIGKITSFGAALSNPQINEGIRRLGQTKEGADALNDSFGSLLSAVLGPSVAAGLDAQQKIKTGTEELKEAFKGLNAVKAEGLSTGAKTTASSEEEAASIKELTDTLSNLKEERQGLTSQEDLLANAQAQEALQAQIDKLEGVGFATKKASAAIKEYADGTLGALSKELSKLNEQQQNAADPEAFKVYQAEIDKLANKIAEIKGELLSTPSIGEVLFVAPENQDTPEPPSLVPDPEKEKERLDAIAESVDRAREIVKGIERRGMTDLERINNDKLQAELDYAAGSIKTAEELTARKLELADQEKQARKQLNEDTLSAAGDLAGALSTLTEEGGAEQKAAATTSALINTYLGVTKALATLPPPVSFITAATTLIQGLAAVKKIQGFAKGGEVNGDIHYGHGPGIQRSNGDNVLITARTGEKILNHGQQRRIESIAGRDVWARAGLPGYAMGGTVAQAVAMPRPTSDQLIQAQQVAALRNINLRPFVQVSDVRSEIASAEMIETRASLG